MLKLLVVAAWEPELVRFRERLAAAPSELEIVTDILGVGLVEASIAMTRHAERYHPTAALLIGTCGAFGAFGAGVVGAGGGVHLADAATSDGASAIPGPMPASARFDGAMHDALVAAGARSVQIANTLGITTDDALAARLSRVRVGDAPPADVEHLEAFAFARACEIAGVPCAAALAVANAVGSRGRAEWLAGHAIASAKAADVAFEALGAIAQALRV